MRFGVKGSLTRRTVERSEYRLEMAGFIVGSQWMAARRQMGRPNLSPRSSGRQEVKMVAKADLAVEYIMQMKPLVDQALKESITPTSDYTKKIWESTSYSLLAGGKRIRPVLCLASCELFGGKVEDALRTACALEMIHTMSLIHDDLPCMDNDDMRRGKPTNHVIYGEDIALLAGDALLAYAFEMVVSTTSVPADRLVQVVRILSHCAGAEGLVGGQVMDLENEGNPHTTLETLNWIHIHKTAALLRASVTSGAVLAGAKPEDVAKIGEFAEKIGLAFQIQDDILDETQSTEMLGKTAGKDAAVIKATFPRLMGLGNSKSEAARLVSEAKEILKQYGDRSGTLGALADLIISRQN